MQRRLRLYKSCHDHPDLLITRYTQTMPMEKQIVNDI